MARPSRPAGTGRTGRKGDVAQIGHQPRDVEPLAADVEIAVIALVARAVERPVAIEMPQRRTEQLLGMGVIRPETLLGEPRRHAETGAQSGRKRARSSRRLLPAAVQQRLERHAVANPQRANPFRPMNLVRRHGDQVAPFGDRHAAIALHRVAQEQRAGRLAPARPIAATGWIVPISLLTSIAATSPVPAGSPHAPRRDRPARRCRPAAL